MEENEDHHDYRKYQKETILERIPNKRECSTQKENTLLYHY